MSNAPSLHEIGFLVKLIHEELDRTINRELESLHLTSSQLAVLMFLRFQGDADTTIRDVQGYLNISHPTAAGLVKRLEQKGFIHVFVDPRDKRARLIRIDPSVREQIIDETRPIADMEELMTRGFSSDEREQLRSLLGRVHRNLTGR